MGGPLDMFLARFGEKWEVFIGEDGFVGGLAARISRGARSSQGLDLWAVDEGGNARLVGWTNREAGRGDGGA